MTVPRLTCFIVDSDQQDHETRLITQDIIHLFSKSTGQKENGAAPLPKSSILQVYFIKYT